MHSIQSNITKYILSGIFLVSMVTGIIIDRVTRQQFNEQFNKTLEHKAWTLATLNDQKFGLVEFDFADEMMPEFEATENAEFFQLWLGSGKVLEKSRSLAGTDLPFLNIALGDTVFQDIELPDGKAGRLVTIHFTPQLDDDEEEDIDQKINISSIVEPQTLQTVILVIAKSRIELIENLQLNRVVIFISFFSMLLISYLIIKHAIKKGLFPLSELSEKVQDIDDQSLNTEIQTHNMVSELSTITLQLNHLFSRLSAAFNREKRFSSNVSHELRTPIAELMALSEVGKSCVDNPEMAAQFFDDAKDIALNMKQIVESLLTLSQSEPGVVTKNLSVFNLNECIQKAIEKSNINNINKLDIAWHRVNLNGIQVYNDSEKFMQILTNIMSNAYKYGLTGSTIHLSFKEKDHLLSLSVSNLSPDLENDDLEHLTEYFWRKDEARTGGKNTGLGLPIVAMLCEVLNISLSFDLKENLFTVTLSNIPVHHFNIDT